jgi:MSHA biogenesis protein MshK
MAAGLKISLTVLMLGLSQLATAETLPDPTRPAIDLSSSGTSGVVVPVEDVSHGLQSVIISPQYRAAIINGETVRLGDKSGDSRLVEVRESSVVLENGQGRRVLEMFPKVSIKTNAVVQQTGIMQKKSSGQANLPENAAGEIK